MRTPRLSALVPLAALLAMPTLAAANCYSIYDAQNRLAFQSTVAPIDLSGRISDAMQARFPGGFFVMIPDDSDCRELRTGSTVSPRFDGGKPSGSAAPEELLQASPLLRGTRSAGTAIESPSGATTTRDAMRSGNALRIRQP